MPKPTTLGLNAPGPITQSAIDQVRELPENELAVSATTDDLRHVDATVAVQKTWSNGFGLGGWAAAKFGAGKPKGSAGVEGKWKW